MQPWQPPDQKPRTPSEPYALQRTYADFYRRQGVQGSGVARSVANQLQPVATVARDWQSDELDLWGYTADQAQTVLGLFPAVGILAGDNQVLVRRVEVMLTFATTQASSLIGAQAHFTKALDLAGYNPVGLGTGEFFPFYLSEPGFSLPTARVLAGEAAALPAITIGGVPVAPAIGPRIQSRTTASDAVGLQLHPWFAPLLSFDDPPLRVNPGEFVYVQHHNAPAAGTRTRLWVNFWLTERPA